MSVSTGRAAGKLTRRSREFEMAARPWLRRALWRVGTRVVRRTARAVRRGDGLALAVGLLLALPAAASMAPAVARLLALGLGLRAGVAVVAWTARRAGGPLALLSRQPWPRGPVVYVQQRREHDPRRGWITVLTVAIDVDDVTHVAELRGRRFTGAISVGHLAALPPGRPGRVRHAARLYNETLQVDVGCR
jgi:hypothetical protein